MSFSIRRLSFALAVATLAACGGSEGAELSPPPPQTLNSITISPPSLTIVQGDSARFSASGLDTQGRSMGPPNLNWNSSNTSVAAVNNTGVVRGVGVGTATVTAASGGLTASVSVVVGRAPARLASLQVSISPTALRVGTSAAIVVSGRDQFGDPFTPSGITFTSSNAAVASVNGSGTVTAISLGAATITVASGSLSATVAVTVSSGVPTQLRISRAAAGAMNGGVMATQPIIELRDEQGNVAPATTAVSVEVGQGATLTGVLTQSAVDGVVTFTGLGVRGAAGSAVVLTFRSGQLPPQTQALTIGPFTFTNGTRLVGSQVLPGRYRSVNAANVSCYWARLRNLTGQGDIIANEIGVGPRLLEVLPSDLAVESSGCAPWSEITGPVTSSPTAAFSDGMYLVGVDVAAGTWRSDGTGANCYWERLRNINGSSAIIANNLQSAPAIVTILPGDVAFSVSRCGTWTKMP